MTNFMRKISLLRGEVSNMELKKSPKKPVNKVIAWLCSLGYLIVAGSGLLFAMQGSVLRCIRMIVNGFDSSYLQTKDIVTFGVLIVTLAFLLFCLNYFEWFLNPRIEKKDKVLIFSTDDVIAPLDRATTTYRIESIDSYKVKKNSVIIRGRIIVKEPIGKEVEKKKCELVGLYDKHDKYQVINILDSFKK